MLYNGVWLWQLGSDVEQTKGGRFLLIFYIAHAVLETGYSLLLRHFSAERATALYVVETFTLLASSVRPCYAPPTGKSTPNGGKRR